MAELHGAAGTLSAAGGAARLSRSAAAARHLRRFGPLLWALLVAGLLLLFVGREQGEIARLWRLLRRASLGWLLVAVGLEAAIFLLTAQKHRLLLRRLGHRIGLVPLLEIGLQRQLIATVLPLGGAAANVQFVRFLHRRGVSTDDGLFASILFSVLGTASVAVVAVPTLTWLAVEREVSRLVLAGAGALLALVLALCAGLWLLVRAADPPAWLARRAPARAAAFAAEARAHGVAPRDLAAPFGLALAIDLLGAGILYAALRAVGVDAAWSVALGGYLIGAIFLLVAPVFQGIGVVELSMAVALERFGLGGAAAVGATLLYRFCELWLPFVASLGAQSTTRRGARLLPPRLPAIVTCLTGVLSILSVIAPHEPRRFDRIERYSRLAPADASRTFALVAGFMLVMLSVSLLRRKRTAWVAALGLLGAVTAAHLLKRHGDVVALVAAVNVALLLAYRSRFRVRSDVPTIARGFARLGLALAVCLAYGTAGFWFLDRRAFGIAFTLDGAWRRTLRLFFTWGDAGLVPRTRYAAWFLDSFSAVGAVALVYAAFALAQPVVWRRATLPAERERARRIVARYGDSALDVFKTWDDKVFFFPSGPDDGVVAYGLAMGTAVVLGDPVAPDAAAFDRLLEEFLDFCDANGWRVAFHQCPPARLATYRRFGFSALKIGEEAVVDLTAFSLAGGHRKGLRSALNKLERDGYRAVWRPAPQPDALLAELRAVSDAWLQIAGRRERGFTLGTWRDAYVRACPVMTIEDAAGAVYAFANVVPDGAPGEATIDLMRRRADAPNGAMDALFVRLMERLRDDGYARFSLGMAPFAAIGAGAGAPAVERGLRLLSEHLTRFFSVDGLRAYKDKFDPAWEPRYLVYPSETALPAIALALVRLTEER